MIRRFQINYIIVEILKIMRKLLNEIQSQQQQQQQLSSNNESHQEDTYFFPKQQPQKLNGNGQISIGPTLAKNYINDQQESPLKQMRILHQLQSTSPKQGAQIIGTARHVEPPVTDNSKVNKNNEIQQQQNSSDASAVTSEGSIGQDIIGVTAQKQTDSLPNSTYFRKDHVITSQQSNVASSGQFHITIDQQQQLSNSSNQNTPYKLQHQPEQTPPPLTNALVATYINNYQQKIQESSATKSLSGNSEILNRGISSSLTKQQTARRQTETDSLSQSTPGVSKRMQQATGYESATASDLLIQNMLNNFQQLRDNFTHSSQKPQPNHGYQTATQNNSFSDVAQQAQQQQLLNMMYHSSPSKIPGSQMIEGSTPPLNNNNENHLSHHQPPQRSLSQVQGGMKPHQSHLQQFLQLLNSTNTQMQTTTHLFDSLRLQHSQTSAQHQQLPRQSVQHNNNDLRASMNNPTGNILNEEQRKYLVQPSYVKGGINSLVYSQFRQVRLDFEHQQIINNRTNSQLTLQQQAPTSSQAVIQPPSPPPPLITEDALRDFYSAKVKMFPNTGRELEVQDDPEAIFESHQADHSGCSEPEKRLSYGIQQEIERYRKQMIFQSGINTSTSSQLADDNVQLPITFRFLRESTLFFNSRFESGNLREVEKVHEYEYNLYLNFDFNTLNYTQWFYFSVRNIKKGFTYRFNLMNLQKDESCYSQGMKPFVYSFQKNREQESNQWQRGCFDIAYAKNNLKTKHRESAPDYEYDENNIPCYVYEDEESQSTYLNTLSFSYTFEYDNDIVFFSYFQPYTYSDLKDYIYTLEKKRDETIGPMKNTLKVQKLCETIEGNTCYVLTISDNVNEISANKQVIFMTGRVHPGEANSSFMVQGVIDFLLQPSCKEAQALREQFVFKIVPMLNPDGVINGNYRCNILGVDLNRRWTNPSKLLHPTIYYSKMLAKQCATDYTMLFYCDFHGHSRKKNVFMYGCACPQSDINQHKNNNLIRLIPYLVGQRNKLFSFQDCKFANEAAKESTARMVIFREMGVLNSYTLESTFFASVNKQGAGTTKKKKDIEEDQQIKAEELKSIGSDLCLTIHQIVQSKILRKKLLQGGGNDGVPQVGGIIGNINSEKINSKESQKEINVGVNATISKRDSGTNQNMQILDSSQISNPIQLLKESHHLPYARQQALITSSSQNANNQLPTHSSIQTFGQSNNGQPNQIFKRKTPQQQAARGQAVLNPNLQGAGAQQPTAQGSTLQPTSRSLQSAAVTIAQAIFNSNNGASANNSASSGQTERSHLGVAVGGSSQPAQIVKHHQVLKQNLMEPPNAISGGVDSILVEQIVLTNSHNLNKLQQSSGNGANLLSGQNVLQISNGSKISPAQQILGLSNDYYKKREQQQSQQVQMQIAPGGGSGITRGRIPEMGSGGRIQGNQGIHGSGSKSVGSSGYNASAQQKQNNKLSQSFQQRQTTYGQPMNPNSGALGGSVLAGNNMMIQNLSHAIGNVADFNHQSLNQQATANGNIFPPVVILKKDPAASTMYKHSNNTNNILATSMQANQLTSGQSQQQQQQQQQNTNGQMAKRPFSNINLVVPAAYPQTTVQQLICQQQVLAAQQQIQGIKQNNLLPQTYHQMLPINNSGAQQQTAPNHGMIQNNSGLNSINGGLSYDSQQPFYNNRPSTSPKNTISNGASAPINAPLMSNPIIQKAIEQQQLLQQQEKQQLQPLTVRKQSNPGGVTTKVQSMRERTNQVRV